MCEMRIEIWHVGKSCDGLSYFSCHLNNNSTLFLFFLLIASFRVFLYYEYDMSEKGTYNFKANKLFFVYQLLFIMFMYKFFVLFMSTANDTCRWLLFILSFLYLLSFFYIFWFDWLICLCLLLLLGMLTDGYCVYFYGK